MPPVSITSLDPQNTVALKVLNKVVLVLFALKELTSCQLMSLCVFVWLLWQQGRWGASRWCHWESRYRDRILKSCFRGGGAASVMPFFFLNSRFEDKFQRERVVVFFVCLFLHSLEILFCWFFTPACMEKCNNYLFLRGQTKNKLIRFPLQNQCGPVCWYFMEADQILK